MIRVILFALRWRKLQRTHPELCDGRRARLGIEAIIAEEAVRLTEPSP